MFSRGSIRFRLGLGPASMPDFIQSREIMADSNYTAKCRNKSKQEAS